MLYLDGDCIVPLENGSVSLVVVSANINKLFYLWENALLKNIEQWELWIIGSPCLLFT
jgi:hypothetical protein